MTLKKFDMIQLLSFFQLNVQIPPPHHLLVEEDCLQLSINIILITVLGGVGERSDLDLTLGDSSHVVILNGDPVHQRPEDLILDLLDAAVLVEVFGVGHHCRGNNLTRTRQVQVSVTSCSDCYWTDST